MKLWIAVLIVAVCATGLYAAEPAPSTLSAMGFQNAQVMTDVQGDLVRGRGSASLATASGFNYLGWGFWSASESTAGAIAGGDDAETAAGAVATGGGFAMSGAIAEGEGVAAAGSTAENAAGWLIFPYSGSSAVAGGAAFGDVTSATAFTVVW